MHPSMASEALISTTGSQVLQRLRLISILHQADGMSIRRLTWSRAHFCDSLECIGSVDREKQDDTSRLFVCLNKSALIRLLCDPYTILLCCPDVLVAPAPDMKVSSLRTVLDSTRCAVGLEKIGAGKIARNIYELSLRTTLFSPLCRTTRGCMFEWFDLEALQ